MQSRGAWAGQKLAAALAKIPHAHGAVAQWLRTVYGVPYNCAAPLPLNGVGPAALAAQVSRKVGIRRSVRHLPPSSSASVRASQEVCASCRPVAHH